MGFVGYLVSNILISVLIIYILHCAWRFIINKFSVKKKKDLINSQINKYNKLIQEIEVTRPRKKDADFTEELKENLENDLSEFMDLEK
mgnify:CR=1 FL=1|jgi:hypothetical protein|uniref:Uncharacterized protein n=1 Tax=viral metagenome TaxID=1070528 RepID=A0A6C0IN07_9ZZZZ